jgi:Patatin-like phospholipase
MSSIPLALGVLVGPILYLWPWLIGIAAYYALLNTEQGASIARSFSTEGYATPTVVTLLFLSWLLAAVGCLVALVASRTEAREDRSVRMRRPWRFARVASGGTWLGILSTAPVVLFASAANSEAAWAVSVALALASVAGIAWTAVSASNEESLASRCLRYVYVRRFWFACMATLMALLPLAIGAWVAMSKPSRLADAGTLLVSMVGITANATLFGVALVVVPLCLRLPWIGAVILAVMTLWNALEPFHIDFENPLLREDTERADLVWINDLKPGTSSFKSCRWMPSSVNDLIDSDAEASNEPRNIDESDNRIYLVSAEGGGIRAAYWTALNLARRDISSNGRFGDQVVSLSGVSGGSLGIATWLAARDRQDLDPAARYDLIDRFLTSDFLSSIAGGLLFLDVPRFLLGPLWPSIRRDHVFEKALADRWLELGSTEFFARPFTNLCIRGFRNPPAIFFNATDVLSGSTVSLSTISTRIIAPRQTAAFRVGIPALGLESTSLHNASVAQVVHISARFPYISPPAQIGINPEIIGMQSEYHRTEKARAAMPRSEQKQAGQEIAARWRKSGLSRTEAWPRVWLLVDGGYVDNTGLLVTEAVAEILKPALERNKSEKGASASKKLQILHFSNDPFGACVPVPSNWRDRLSAKARRHVEATGRSQFRCLQEIHQLEQSLIPAPLQWFLAPLETLITVRQTHSDRLLKQFSDQIGVAFFSSVSNLLTGAYDLKIGKPAIEALQRRRDELILSRIAEIEEMVRQGVVTRKVADEYSVALNEWKKSADRRVEDERCHVPPDSHVPFLGWTLDKGNAKLMKCLIPTDALGQSFNIPGLPQKRTPP